ncbi:hypothetical protein BYT27DRAFT_7180639 [Phlegmacium glaucopus]|nr:hypothetical protein BYT27DRAFT_7180639 [Phlegmacium glaucopus]
MHTLALAFISTLSLSVHAASIGDSVSQLVAREQSLHHNPRFRNPDFVSTESFEPAGKISQRQVNPSFGLMGSLVTSQLTPNIVTQNSLPANAAAAGLAAGQPLVGLGSLLTGQLIPNIVTQNSLPANAAGLTAGQPLVGLVTSQLTPNIVTQNPLPANAAAAGGQPLNLGSLATGQLTSNIVTQNQLANTAGPAALSGQPSFGLMGSLVTGQLTPQLGVSNAAVDSARTASATSSLGVNTPLSGRDISSLAPPFLAGSERITPRGEDALKRQLPTLPVPTLPTLPIPTPALTVPIGRNLGASYIPPVTRNLPTANLPTREDSMKISDDQIEDMRFLEQGADEPEESF